VQRAHYRRRDHGCAPHRLLQARAQLRLR
jgi:hypothetical protein